MTDEPVRFRNARPGDEHFVAVAVRGIAATEGVLHRVEAEPTDYARLMFGDRAPLHGVIATSEGRSIGCLLWREIVYTYAGRLGIHVEDIYVDAGYRNRGIGRALFAELARAGRVRRIYPAAMAGEARQRRRHRLLPTHRRGDG